MEFISTSDARWNEVLARAQHDVYHLADYVDFVGRQVKGSPCGFYMTAGRQQVLIPLILRPLPDELGGAAEGFDACSPYGYPGPIATGALTSEQGWQMLEYFREAGRALGLVSTFLRLHPLLHSVNIAAERLDQGITVMRHGRTVAIDLRQGEDALDRQLRSNHRRDIRKLRSRGFEVRVDDWRDYRAFQQIYVKTMQRVQADASYYFSPDYFEQLRACLGEHLHLGTVVSPEGRVAAAGLFTVRGSLMQYHLGGTDQAYLSQAPSKLMFHTIRGWAKAKGIHLYHLGGGVGGREDSLYNFKCGFGPLRFPFETVRVVHDPARYSSLSQRRGCLGSGATDSPDGFFPRYRASDIVDQASGGRLSASQEGHTVA